MHTMPPSPWTVAAIDTVSFVAAWLLFAAKVWNATTIDLTFFFGALIFPAAIVFWWGFGWAYKLAAGKASARSAAVQGCLWGVFLAVLTLLLLLIFGSKVSIRALPDWELLRDLSLTLLRTVVWFGVGGMATALLLHAENMLLTRVKARVLGEP